MVCVSWLRWISWKQPTRTCTARVFALEVTRVPTVLMQHRHCVLRFIPPAFIQVRLKSFSLFPFHPSPILSAPLLFFAPSWLSLVLRKPLRTCSATWTWGMSHPGLPEELAMLLRCPRQPACLTELWGWMRRERLYLRREEGERGGGVRAGGEQRGVKSG